MPGPRPQDVYSPVPSVSPTTGAPSDYLGVRANPSSFGGQIGAAISGAGKSIENVGNQAVDVALQQQGLANEHAANVADMQLATEGGEVYNKYRTLQGLDASNAKDQAVNDYLAVYNKISNSLTSPMARRAFEQVATRRMSFTIQDMNSYAADQQKRAYIQGNADSMNLSVANASKPDVAINPQQFGFELGNIKFQTNTMFTAPGYGKYQTVPATTTKNGTLQFDTSTTEGKVAQADYDNYLDQVVGKAWENRFEVLAKDPIHGNPLEAEKELEANKDVIPPQAYLRISNMLGPTVRNAQARDIADGLVSSIPQNRDYIWNNYADIVQKARDEVKAQYGDNIELEDAAAARTEQRLNDVIRTYNYQMRSNTDAVYGAIYGKNTNGQPLTDPSQLDADPQTRQAWTNLQSANPKLANSITNKLMTANSRGMSTSYGTDFYKHLTDILGNPHADPHELTDYVGADKNSPLTNTGFYKLRGISERNDTPEGHAFNQAELEFISKLHSQFTGAGQIPGISPTQSNSQFDKALAEIIPKIDAGFKAGKTASELFDPKSKDYVSTGIAPPSLASLMQRAQANLAASNPQINKFDFNTLAGVKDYKEGIGSLKKALESKQITREQAIQYALKRKWVQPNPPSVPLPYQGQ